MFKNLAAKFKHASLKNTIYQSMVFMFAPVLYVDSNSFIFVMLRQLSMILLDMSDNPNMYKDRESNPGPQPCEGRVITS